MTTHCLPHAYHSLLNAGLSHWIPPLMQLLHQYEGIERALEPDQLPLSFLADKLELITTFPTNEQENFFFEATASLPLFFYRVAADGEFWNPREETFRQFKRRVNAMAIWQDWTPMFSTRDVKHWLYANLQVSHHARATA